MVKHTVDVDDPAVLKRIISLWNEGESVQRIAFIIDSTYWRVYSQVRRSNLRRYFQLDPTVKSDIAKAIKSDPACVKNQIANEIGVHRSTISRIRT